jgi:hypothetical protein
MPSLHLVKVASKFEGYRNTLDKKRKEVFDYIFFELAGRREETLVMHPNHTEAVMMNILVEMEMQQQRMDMRLQQLEEKK